MVTSGQCSCLVAAADPALPQTSIKDVDDFVPFDQLDSSFLDDATEVKETREAGGEDSERSEVNLSVNTLTLGYCSLTFTRNSCWSVRAAPSECPVVEFLVCILPSHE